ncbi:hypothetical protein NL529_28265, partial [Klebsiella pneumoniae]|nr:hypothetical protein [Klebsiella pneumoniae]
INTSNFLRNTFGNVYYQGRAGATINQAPGGFGVVLYGTTGGIGGGNIGFAGGTTTGGGFGTTAGRTGIGGGLGGTGGGFGTGGGLGGRTGG